MDSNNGLADLKDRGREAGKKAAYTYASLVMRLQNGPDRQAYNEGFIEGVLAELKAYSE